MCVCAYVYTSYFFLDCGGVTGIGGCSFVRTLEGGRASIATSEQVVTVPFFFLLTERLVATTLCMVHFTGCHARRSECSHCPPSAPFIIEKMRCIGSEGANARACVCSEPSSGAQEADIIACLLKPGPGLWPPLRSDFLRCAVLRGSIPGSIPSAFP